MSPATQAKQVSGLLVGKTDFLFIPGAPDDSLPTNGFNTWAALQTASAPFARISVQCDDTFVSPVTIPTGSWPNVGEVTGSSTSSADNGTPTNLSLTDGCSLPNCFSFSQLSITTHATVAYPIVVSDNQTLSLCDCTVQKTGPIGSILVTPGLGFSSPVITCTSDGAVLTFIDSLTIDVSPTVSSGNGLLVNLTNSLLNENVFRGIGTFSADAEASVTLFDSASNGYSGNAVSTTQPSISSVSWTDLSMTDVIHFGAQTVTVSAPGTPRTVAAWQNATDYALVGGVPDPGTGAVAPESGLRTLLRVTGVSSTASDLGKTATIQLWKNGVVVPGAVILFPLGETSPQYPGVLFADNYAESDIYTVSVDISAAMVGTFTKLLVALS